jgi:hypothetical protein
MNDEWTRPRYSMKSNGNGNGKQVGRQPNLQPSMQPSMQPGMQSNRQGVRSSQIGEDGFWLNKLSSIVLQSYRTNKNGENVKGLFPVETNQLSSTSIILLYASASYCKPCTKFTRKLNYIYNAMKTYDPQIVEAILLSHDMTNDSFNKYFQEEMSFLALPFEASKNHRDTILGKTRVNHIPSVFAFDNRGNYLGEIKDRLESLFYDVQTSLHDAKEIQQYIAEYFTLLLTNRGGVGEALGGNPSSKPSNNPSNNSSSNSSSNSSNNPSNNPLSNPLSNPSSNPPDNPSSNIEGIARSSNELLSRSNNLDNVFSGF